MLATASGIRKEVAEIFRSSRRTLPSQAAATSLVDHQSGQLYDPNAAPYMSEPLDMMASREHEATILLGPSRSSKSFTLVMGGLTYIITCDPADTTVLHMNQAESRQWSKADLARTIAASPDLFEQLGPGSGSNNVDMKLMRNGMALRMGYPSISCVSAKTIRWVFITDADNLTGDMPLNALFPQAAKRTTTFMSAGHTVVEGNPAEDYSDIHWTPTPGSHEGPPATGLVSLYNSGDRRRFYWPCPHCGEYSQAEPGLTPFKLLPELEELKALSQSSNLSEIAQRLAVVVCPNNGCEIRHEHKQQMNSRGRWLKEGQTIDHAGVIHGAGVISRRATFWVAGVMAAYQSWPSMIEQYLQAIRHFSATGEDSEVKARLNTDFAWPHLPFALQNRREKHAIQARAVEDYRKMDVPDGVRYLICTVDVQKNAFVVQVTGFGAHGHHWLIDRYSIRESEREKPNGGRYPIDPARYAEDWDVLTTKCVARSYRLAGPGETRSMHVKLTLIDSGGEAGVTSRAYDYWRSLVALGMRNKMRLVKGDPNLNAPRWTEAYPDTKGRKDRNSGSAGDVPVILINTTMVKDVVMAEIEKEIEGEGYYHFPAWIGKEKWFFDEITAETRGPKRWEVPAHVRNEAFDLFCYAHVGNLILKGNLINWDQHAMVPGWAKPWDSNSDVSDGARLPPPRPVRKSPQRGTRSGGVY